MSSDGKHGVKPPPELTVAEFLRSYDKLSDAEFYAFWDKLPEADKDFLSRIIAKKLVGKVGLDAVRRVGQKLAVEIADAVKSGKAEVGVTPPKRVAEAAFLAVWDELSDSEKEWIASVKDEVDWEGIAVEARQRITEELNEAKADKADDDFFNQPPEPLTDAEFSAIWDRLSELDSEGVKAELRKLVAERQLNEGKAVEARRRIAEEQLRKATRGKAFWTFAETPEPAPPSRNPWLKWTFAAAMVALCLFYALWA